MRRNGRDRGAAGTAIASVRTRRRARFLFMSSALSPHGTVWRFAGEETSELRVGNRSWELSFERGGVIGRVVENRAVGEEAGTAVAATGRCGGRRRCDAGLLDHDVGRRADDQI